MKYANVKQHLRKTKQETRQQEREAKRQARYNNTNNIWR